MNDSMTAPTALDALAGRCEAATDADRMLDALIAAGHDRNLTGTRFATAQSWADEAIRERWNFPRYTASLDAAMTLVPEGMRFYVDNGTLDGGKSHACAWIAGASGGCKHAATPALALCAAALRARTRTQETTDVE